MSTTSTKAPSVLRPAGPAQIHERLGFGTAFSAELAHMVRVSRQVASAASARVANPRTAPTVMRPPYDLD
jgi:hypothetical protein